MSRVFKTEARAFKAVERLRRYHGVWAGVIKVSEREYRLTYDPLTDND